MQLHCSCTGVVVVFLVGSGVIACLAGETDPYAWMHGDELAANCANFSEAEEVKFREAGNLLEIRPICLPRDHWLHRDSHGKPATHLGWPVAVKIDSVIHVFYRRTFGHGIEDNSHLEGAASGAVARSTDNGRTFGPVPWLKNSCLDDLEPGMRPRQSRLYGMNAVGVIDGKIVFSSRWGVCRSNDNGITWKYLVGAGSPEQLPSNPAYGQGPELLVHPKKGLVSIGATADCKLLLRTSQDYGRTWSEEVYPSGEPLQEPSGCFYQGKLLLMPRHDREEYTQFWSETGWAPFCRARTNITPGERDTTDVKYNPVSKRIEALVTNRIGGGPGHEGDNCTTLNLWSISPDKFTGGSGNWRFEGTLVRSEGREHDRSNPLKLDRDGMHPGGTVIDKEQGVQYIYIYLGHFPGPAGIFQIKRTLDTDALREYLLKSRSAISQH